MSKYREKPSPEVISAQGEYLEVAWDYACQNDSFNPEFIESLKDAFERWGYLTDNQYAALRKIVEKFKMFQKVRGYGD